MNGQRGPHVPTSFLVAFGPEIDHRTRSAVGLAELPWNIPVKIETEVLIWD